MNELAARRLRIAARHGWSFGKMMSGGCVWSFPPEKRPAFLSMTLEEVIGAFDQSPDKTEGLVTVFEDLPDPTRRIADAWPLTIEMNAAGYNVVVEWAKDRAGGKTSWWCEVFYAPPNPNPSPLQLAISPICVAKSSASEAPEAISAAYEIWADAVQHKTFMSYDKEISHHDYDSRT